MSPFVPAFLPLDRCDLSSAERRLRDRLAKGPAFAVRVAGRGQWRQQGSRDPLNDRLLSQLIGAGLVQVRGAPSALMAELSPMGRRLKP